MTVGGRCPFQFVRPELLRLSSDQSPIFGIVAERRHYDVHVGLAPNPIIVRHGTGYSKGVLQAPYHFALIAIV